MSSAATTSKPVLPPLQTPKSASFPSEIVSTPMSAHPLSAFIKQEQDLKTPITPPVAYTDFLKALTPMLASPPPSALARSLSDESVSSTKESVNSARSTNTSFSSHSYSEKHLSPTFMPPPTPTSAPAGTGRGTPTHLKRLRIPQYSPVFSPGSTVKSPRTATSMPSAIGSMIYSPFSPADWTGRSNFDYIMTPRSACPKPVSVRSVVTRTVTYKRTNLEPAPKGKRRKTASTASSVMSEEESKDSTKTLTKIEESGSEDVKHMPPPPPAIAVSPATSASQSDASSVSSSSSSSSSSTTSEP